MEDLVITDKIDLENGSIKVSLEISGLSQNKEKPLVLEREIAEKDLKRFVNGLANYLAAIIEFDLYNNGMMILFMHLSAACIDAGLINHPSGRIHNDN
jgi:hypothetical protein